MTKVIVQSAKMGFHAKWIQFLKKYNCSVDVIDLQGMNSLEKCRSTDAVMWHLQMNPSLLQSTNSILNPIEFGLGKTVFPNWQTRWHFENKISQANLLKTLEVRTPENYVFWHKQEALEWTKSAKYPLVHKYAAGAGSLYVRLVNDERTASNLIKASFSSRGRWQQTGYFPVKGRPYNIRVRNSIANRLLRFQDAIILALSNRASRLPRDHWLPEKDCILFQEFLPGNSFDTRVTIIGSRAFAFRRFNKAGDFRASGSGMIDHDQKAIDKDAIGIAFAISERAGFQSMAYDFLYSEEKGLVVSEMCFGFQNKAVFDCPGYWDSDLNYHPGHMWPEEAHVVDLIYSIDSL